VERTSIQSGSYLSFHLSVVLANTPTASASRLACNNFVVKAIPSEAEGSERRAFRAATAAI